MKQGQDNNLQTIQNKKQLMLQNGNEEEFQGNKNIQGSQQLMKEFNLDQNSILILVIIDILDNLIDGLQLLMAYSNVGLFKDMNQYIALPCNQNDQEFQYYYKIFPLLIATLSLNLIILVKTLQTKRQAYNLVKDDLNNLIISAQKQIKFSQILYKDHCFQCSMVQLRLLLRIELIVQTVKQQIGIGDVIIIILTIIWLAERQKSWNYKIIILDFNIIYLVIRLQMNLNIFNILKSVFLILVIFFQYFNRATLQKQYELFISTFSKYLQSFSQYDSTFQNINFRFIDASNKQMTQLYKQSGQLSNQVQSQIATEKKIERISFFTQKDYHKAQSNHSTPNQGSPIIFTPQKYDKQLQFMKQQSSLKRTQSISSIFEQIPSSIQNYKKQTAGRCLINADFIQDKNYFVSNLSTQVLNQINQGVVLMDLNQCIVFHNKQMLKILSIQKSSKIIRKLFQLKKEVKVKDGDLLDKNLTGDDSKALNSIIKMTSKITNNQQESSNLNQFSLEVNGKVKTQNVNNNGLQAILSDSQGQQACGRSFRTSDQKKSDYLNNKSASQSDIQMAPPKVIFKNKIRQGDDEEQHDNGNQISIKEVEEDQYSDNEYSNTYSPVKFDTKTSYKKRNKNIQNLKQTFQFKKKQTGDSKKELKDKYFYSTDEKSFEIIIQEIISLVQIYRQNIGHRPCKSENNLDFNTLIQEEWLKNCEKTVQILQNQGYTFNAILEEEQKVATLSYLREHSNHEIASEDPKIATTSKNNLQVPQPQSFTKGVNSLADLKQQQQAQNQNDVKKQKVNKIIRVQIKLWNSPISTEEKRDEVKESSIDNIGNNQILSQSNSDQPKQAKKKNFLIHEKFHNPMLFIIFQDITKQIEQEEQDQMNRFKLKILSSISHELRTPLNCSMSMLQMLLQSDHISEALKQDYLQPAFFNNQLLYFIINDILDYAQISQNSFQLKFSSFELYPTLQECLNIFSYSAEFKGIEIFLSVDNSIPRVINSDQERIKQVLINLVSNAIKYTNSGYINVNASLSPDQKDLIEISVEDTGCGIPPHLHNIIFDYMDNPGKKKKELNSTGAGLGLTISQKIVKGLSENKGISLQSEVGVGSKFTFYVKNRDFTNQKSQVGIKSNQFNNIMLNWKSVSYTTLQSQEFKSDLSSLKGLTNKSQQTPKHYSQSPISKGSFNSNSVVGKEETEKKQFLTTFIRNSFMRKGSKFLEENMHQKELSNQDYGNNEFLNQNLNSDRALNKRKSNNSISISYMLDKSNILQEGSENKKNQTDSKKNRQPMKSCDILESISDIDNQTPQIQNLNPFQGKSSIFQQDLIENQILQKQSSSVSSTIYTQSTPKPGSHLEQQTPIQNFNNQAKFQLNQNYQGQKQYQDKNNNSQPDYFKSNQKPESFSDFNQIQKKRNSFNANLTTSNYQYQQLKDISQIDLETGRNASFHNNSQIFQDTSRLIQGNYKEELDLNKTQQDQNNITFNLELQNESERANNFSLKQLNLQNQSQQIDEEINPAIKKEFQINLKKNQNTELKITKESSKKKLFIQINDNQNELDGQDMDALIQQNSQDHLQQKQNKIKKKLQLYFSKKKCQCNEVLVVDDNQFNLLVMIKLLQSYSIIADQAFDGQKALDLVIQKSKNACCSHYRLILMDIDMPIMNGYQSTQAILDFYKQKHPNVNPPIISACTAFVSNEDKAQAKKRGMKFFIGKPIQIFHLDFVLEQSLLKKKK
ncbi:ATPase, histidine kinase-, DNA gyrase B (macronuclear) [Tetrahymena thermophila SB210]|uniref:histidine kinase n=1 Tax=Tetrahymena thermophila (strain SB210) TaxID=312017 RepID=Q22SS9_TETTS|nr:ATPase, histidine kinase-, DNA gyrase B [Tetrahymena thermophila SB210]EAR88385.2 ATPase, histidine kinase-, DNA gyrase B [Tetrahymena thermophila SB210]|eukprot:XP_001008630.2 ATPase, histidine kinase-, DNA gyrase B [Tetrahymena thermophila SB210]